MNKMQGMPEHGTIRLKASGSKAVVFKNGTWQKTTKQFLDTLHVIDLFKSHHNFSLLVDKKNPQFLKGQLSFDGKAQGARINFLPDGRKLSGAYSLFAKNLCVHDESSNTHWDVLYENPTGFAYLYTLRKKNAHTKKKYKAVKEFAKVYPNLFAKVNAGLRDKKDNFALPMYTLLTTLMRVGNEIYFKTHKHKGLTTLKKKDISIKGSKVTFQYLSKGGVPMKTTQEFPQSYIARLKELLRPLKKNDFVFTSKQSGRPLKDTDFKKAFKRYCGKEFFPHIVRSHYATQRAKEFLKAHRDASKEEVKEFYLHIAQKLGHKKFVKKKHQWQDSFNVTMHHYVEPEIVEKIAGLVKK